MAGPVERAIRTSIEPGKRLHTLPRRAPFVVQAVDEQGVVLLLGRGRFRTPLSWDCLESIPPFLQGRGWVRIGGVFSTDSDPGTLDGYMKQYVKRTTANWVASLLAEAGLVEVNREPPASVRLRLAGREPAGSQITTSGLRSRIGLIACTKTKLNRPAPARELYSASDLFRKAATYCDAYLDGWFVLSAKYGLVEPERVLEPYDVTLKTMRRSERRDWGKRVAEQLRQLGDVTLEAHAGADYVRPLLEAGLSVHEPLRGLSIGPRKHWYLEQLARINRNKT